MKPFVRPGFQASITSARALVRIVLRPAKSNSAACADPSRQRDFPGPAQRQATRHPSRHFGNFTHVEHRAQHEPVRDCQLPGHARALIAQNFRGPLAEFGSIFPVPDQIGGHTTGPDRQVRSRVGGPPSAPAPQPVAQFGRHAFWRLPARAVCAASKAIARATRKGSPARSASSRCRL